MGSIRMKKTYKNERYSQTITFNLKPRHRTIVHPPGQLRVQVFSQVPDGHQDISSCGCDLVRWKQKPMRSEVPSLYAVGVFDTYGIGPVHCCSCSWVEQLVGLAVVVWLVAYGLYCLQDKEP